MRDMTTSDRPMWFRFAKPHTHVIAWGTSEEMRTLASVWPTLTVTEATAADVAAVRGTSSAHTIASLLETIRQLEEEPEPMTRSDWRDVQGDLAYDEGR